MKYYPGNGDLCANWTKVQCIS